MFLKKRDFLTRIMNTKHEELENIGISENLRVYRKHLTTNIM